MRLPRPALALLGLVLAGPALLSAQDQPLAAGSEGVPVPKKKKHVQPVYPREALAQGIRGIVILDLVIDTEGRVAETAIIRSIPGLDEAALAAAQQWVYEPVEVDGEPVSVRLTVPITFALKLPEMTRQDGIPELRQGVTPPWPQEARGGGQAVANVTLEPDGRIGLARIVEGEEPWSTSLLQALRTWRFRSPPDGVSVSFRVEAEFVPGGSESGGVELRLTGLNETTLFDAPAEEDVARSELLPEAATPQVGSEEMPVPDSAPPEPEPAASPFDPTRPATGPEVAESEAAAPEARPEGSPEPTAAAPPPPPTPPSPEVPEPTAAAAMPGPAPEPEAAAEASAAAPAATKPAAEAPPPTPESAAPAADAATPSAGLAPETTPTPPGEPFPAPASVDRSAPPPVEVLTAAPPPLPPENGISAIRGVELEPGVPDLTRGRRPVSPPFARMARASGVVTVDFSVSAGGITAVQRAEGPEVFRPAAVQAVESWVFRRTRADRAYLTAVFTYEDDLASAVVRPQPAR